VVFGDNMNMCEIKKSSGILTMGVGGAKNRNGAFFPIEFIGVFL
jgi:hypothetical protein